MSEFTRIMMEADQRGPVDGRNVDEEEITASDGTRVQVVENEYDKKRGILK